MNNDISHEGDKLSFIDSTRLSCLQKRNSIINDYYELLGLHNPTKLPLATAVPLTRDVPVATDLTLSTGDSDTKIGGNQK
jgi:hypothetical protein